MQIEKQLKQPLLTCFFCKDECVCNDMWQISNIVGHTWAFKLNGQA